MLTRTHVVTPLPAWETNRLKRITSYPKRQLVDTALALALAGIDANELASNPTLAGRYVESFVVAQLRPEVDAAGGHLAHLRTSGGDQEVDIVIDIGGQLIAIDVKAGVNPNPLRCTSPVMVP
jgi:predicted AAA+ superfamily ATPase